MKRLTGIEFGEAYAINALDQIVGWCAVQDRQIGFLWDDGVVTYITGPEGAKQVFARGINDLGQVIGMADFGQIRQAFIWEK